MNKFKTGLVVYDKIKFVWVCRSASSIVQVYPEISNVWDELVNVWGLKRAKNACETDRNRTSCQNLVDSLQLTELYQEGAIRFGRPSFESILDDSTKEVLEKSHENAATNTLFAYCGSHSLARHIKEVHMMNNMILSTTGNTHHGFDLVIQSYVGLVASKKIVTVLEKDSEDDGSPKVFVPNKNRTIEPDMIHENNFFQKKNLVL